MTFLEGKPTTRSLSKVNVHMYIVDLFHHLKLFWVGFSMTIGIQKYLVNKSYKGTKRVDKNEIKDISLFDMYGVVASKILYFTDISLFDIQRYFIV